MVQVSEKHTDRCHSRGQDKLSSPSPATEQQSDILHKYPLLFLMPEIQMGNELFFTAKERALHLESQNHHKIS